MKIAAMNNREVILQLLINANANIDIQDENGDTALILGTKRIILLSVIFI